MNKIISSILTTFTQTSEIKVFQDLERQSAAFVKHKACGIRPDFQLFKTQADKQDKPVFVFELKKQKVYGNQAYNKTLNEHLPQLFKQLRHLSIEHNVPVMYGTLCNYQEWYFVRFNLKSEIETQYCSQKSTVIQSRSPMYEVSSPIKLCD